MSGLTTRSTDRHDAALSRLARQTTGRLVRPGHADYDVARAVWNGSIDRHPAAVLTCAGPDDVAAGLAVARQHGLPVAVRGGGHNVAGFGTVDDGLVLDMSAMADVVVDPVARTVTCGAGVLGRDLDRATQAHGLATTTGVMSTTGVTGLTLGGGIGWLQRRLGLACDNLRAADLVTVDGERLHVTADTDPELFWGLRGGGGNFGVVTALTFDLHPVGPEVFSGLTAWPAEHTGDVLRFLRDFVVDAPDELMLVAVHRTAPPAPWLPEALHGRPIVALAGCWAGGVEDGERALAPLRRFGDPIGDVYTARPYADFQAMFDASWAPGLRNYWKAEYLTGLPDETIDTLARYAVAHTSPLSDFKVALMGGAVARVGEQDTATPFRDAAWVLNINTRWAEPNQDDTHVAHTRAIFDEVSRQASAGGTYVNFLGAEGADRTRHAYGEATFVRLQGLKRRWDPDNVLQLNQNIPPGSPTPTSSVTPAG